MPGPVISNWGRWGKEDQLGALNLMTPESILQAVRLVRKGVLYNLAVPLDKDGPQYPFFHKTWRVTHFTADPTPGASQAVSHGPPPSLREAARAAGRGQ